MTTSTAGNGCARTQADTVSAARAANLQWRRMLMAFLLECGMQVLRRFRVDLRIPAVGWDSPFQYLNDVVDDHVGHRLPQLCDRAPDMRRQDDVGHAEQRRFDARLALVDIERGAGDAPIRQ